MTLKVWPANVAPAKGWPAKGAPAKPVFVAFPGPLSSPANGIYVPFRADFLTGFLTGLG